jgi:hypothetical protein
VLTAPVTLTSRVLPGVGVDLAQVFGG